MVQFRRAFVGEQTPEVRFEPCTVWEAGPDPAAGACVACGWLEEDHWLAELERREAGQRLAATTT
jgi:hypothetical protein